MVFALLLTAVFLYLIASQTGVGAGAEGFVTGFALRGDEHDLSDARLITQPRPKDRNIEPVHRPGFTIDQLTRQVRQLEDDLYDDTPRCKICILNHFRSLEDTARAIIGPETTIKFANETMPILKFIQEIKRQFIGGMDYSYTAQKILKLREMLANYGLTGGFSD